MNKQNKRALNRSMRAVFLESRGTIDSVNCNWDPKMEKCDSHSIFTFDIHWDAGFESDAVILNDWGFSGVPVHICVCIPFRVHRQENTDLNLFHQRLPIWSQTIDPILGCILPWERGAGTRELSLRPLGNTVECVHFLHSFIIRGASFIWFC